jgi:plastocyanin
VPARGTVGITRKGINSAGAVVILLLVGLGAVSVVYVTSTQSTSDQISSQSQQISDLKSEVLQLASEYSLGQGISGARLALPVMNQTPTIRTIRETWYLSTSAHQDRFDPTFIIVNAGDTVRLTLIDNDTVAHDFVIGPPYNIIVNATVPGLVNDLTGQTFTTPSRNNSPGVVVTGKPGNVSASFTFVAVYTGIYEFVCTYHAQVGMIGYLVVLPNVGYKTSTTSTTTTSINAGTSVAVSIVPGAGTPPNKGFSPDNITVVIGVNNTVTWTNNDISIHTVTANDGSFDSGYLNGGASFSYTFTRPGIYQYHCTIHPWMTGFVTVKAD